MKNLRRSLIIATTHQVRVGATDYKSGNGGVGGGGVGRPKRSSISVTTGFVRYN